MCRKVIAQVVRQGYRSFPAKRYLVIPPPGGAGVWTTTHEENAHVFHSAAEVYQHLKRLRPRDAFSYFDINIIETMEENDEPDALENR